MTQAATTESAKLADTMRAESARLSRLLDQQGIHWREREAMVELRWNLILAANMLRGAALETADESYDLDWLELIGAVLSIGPVGQTQAWFRVPVAGKPDGALLLDHAEDTPRGPWVLAPGNRGETWTYSYDHAVPVGELPTKRHVLALLWAMGYDVPLPMVASPSAPAACDPCGGTGRADGQSPHDDERERIAEVIYNCLSVLPDWVPFKPGGNSLVQDACRRAASIVMAKLAAATKPAVAACTKTEAAREFGRHSGEVWECIPSYRKTSLLARVDGVLQHAFPGSSWKPEPAPVEPPNEAL